MVATDVTDYQLLVVHRKRNGKFKALRASPAEASTLGAGEYAFRTRLRIHKGDYIGLSSDRYATRNTPNARYAEFRPTLAPGDTARPDYRDPAEALFNATIKRRR